MRVLAAGFAAVFASLTVALVLGLLPSSIRRRNRRSRTETKTEVALQQAGLAVSPTRIHVASVGCAASTFVCVYGLSGIGMVALVPALFAGLIPRWWIARKAARRQEGIQRAWPDAVRDLVASISAGVSLQHALERLGEFGPEALRPVFVRFAITARSVGVASALEAVRDDLADATSDRVIEVLLVAHERGGAIVPEILRDLAAATTRDIWVLEQVQTESLEQRINARAVFALPWVVLIAITLQEGPFREFYRSAAGLAVIVVGGIASAFGMFVVRRLGAQLPEPRVLGR
ncbi:MAG: type II secretion system F family protein [Acidimicrobiia bacterium]